MSSRNDDNTGLAAVGGVLAMVGLFFFAVLAFIALIFTILALIAFFIRPIRIGSFTMSEAEAQRFLTWSAAGAITPLKHNGMESYIEDLFDPELLKTKLNGKTFNPKKEHAADSEYGKMAFAESVVRQNANTIDFSGFTPLFERIEGAISDYAAKAKAGKKN